MRSVSILAIIAAAILPEVACSDSAGPSLHGPAFLTATVEGQSFDADTTVAFLFGVTPAIGLLSAAGVARDSEDSTREIYISLRDFPRSGRFAIGDMTAASSAAFSITYHTGGIADSIVSYQSDPANPGTLRITGIDRGDSLVTGQFAFVGVSDAAHPDPHAVSGTFRVRYTYQQIFLPGTE